MNTLVISCMDRRLNTLIEKDYPESIIIRNAGANVNPVIGEIKDIMQDKDIRKIVVAAHTDCEAMKKVYNVINKSDSAIEDLEQNLISLFRGMKFKDINELEKLNLEMQVDKLKNEFPDLEIIGKMINTSEIKGDKEFKNHGLIIMNPSKPDYAGLLKDLKANPFEMYIIQSDFEEAIADIQLAANDLKTNPIHIVTIDKENPRESKKNSERLKMLLHKNDISSYIYKNKSK